MNIFTIAFKSLRHRALNTFLSVLILAFGLGLIMVMLSAQKQFEEAFTRNIRGIDLVVGAKGSPLQLILSAVYHVDAPTGNIDLAEFEKLAKNPMVKEAIPLAYGDNYMGFRIVGTEHSYAKHYKLELARGNWFNKPFEVVIGQAVAAESGLGLGDHFSGSHGLSAQGEAHAEKEFVVKGIAAPSGTVADKLILTPLESVWLVHEHQEHQGEAHQHEKEPREITAGLLKYRNAMAIMMLPRLVNEKTNMQAAMPAIEINRLFTLAEGAVQLLNALGYLLVAIAAISVFTALLQSLKDEEPQLAFLRTLGIGRGKIFTLILLKGLLLGLLGYTFALLLSQLALLGMSFYLHSQVQYQLQLQVFSLANLYLLLGVLALTLLSSLAPALRAYRLNISKTLANA